MSAEEADVLIHAVWDAEEPYHVVEDWLSARHLLALQTDEQPGNGNARCETDVARSLISLARFAGKARVKSLV